VATSLNQHALSRSSAAGMTQMAQGIFLGTLFYAPPEQFGDSQYGQPGAKSDLFSTGAALYRLMTEASPQNLNPLRLAADAPAELFLLLCQCKEENPAQRPDSAQLASRLEALQAEAGIARRQAEQVAVAKKAEQEAQRKAAEQEQRRKAEQAAVAKKAQQEARRKAAEQEEQRRQAEQAAIAKKAQQEAQRKAAEQEEQRRKAEQAVVAKRRQAERPFQPTPQPKRRLPLKAFAILIVIGLVALTWFNWLEKSDTGQKIPTAGNIDQKQAGEVVRDRLKDGSLGPEMVWIPAGRFQMGDIQGGGYSDEKPVHWVSINKFAMGRYEVTFAEYDKFAEATGRTKPSDRGWGRGNRPVINVSWNDVTAYAEWLSQQTGKQYRLPTEAEWEYAARAGTETKYWWGNDIGSNRANCDGCGSRWDDKSTAPVGSFAANPFGLFDTVGNVWEWTCSEYEEKYTGKEQRCAKSAGRFAVRGGSWGDSAHRVRSAYRSWDTPAERGDFLGVRLVRHL
jgi:formylglycine-generating enzyme required for sulfatase activity